MGRLELVDPSLRGQLVQNRGRELICPVEEGNVICKVAPNEESFEVVFGCKFCASRGPHFVPNRIDQSLDVVLVAIVNNAIVVFQSQKSLHFILQDNLSLAADELITILERKMHLFDSDVGLIGLCVLPQELQLRCPSVFLGPMNILLDEVIQDLFVQQLLQQESIIFLEVIGGIDLSGRHGGYDIFSLVLHLVDLVLPVLDVLSCVLPHDLAELGKRIWSVLLIVNGNSGVVTEVYSTDGQEMLDVVLLHQTAQVVLDCLVPAAAKGSAV